METNQVSNNLLGQYGIATSGLITGLMVHSIELEPTRANVYRITAATDVAGTNKQVLYAGKKSIDEGLLQPAPAGLNSALTGKPIFALIGGAHESYVNDREGNTTWIRNKERALKPLAAIS